MDNCLQKSQTKPSEEQVLRQICTVADVMRVANLHTSGHLLRVLHSILLGGLKVTGQYQQFKQQVSKPCQNINTYKTFEHFSH